jgi:hypothetical protein
MSTGRIIWITFCLGWVGFWTLTILLGNVFGLILAPLSIIACFFPVGRTPALQRPNYRGDVPSSTEDPRFTTAEKENYFDTQARNTATRIYPR